MSAIYFENCDLIQLGQSDFARIKQLADDSPLKRARYCLHRNPDDSIHEMIIAMRKDTYVHPHRHHRKSESFHIIEGEVLVIFFDNAGQVTQRLYLGECRSGRPFYCRINCAWWHMVIPLTPYVVIHETTAGPFNPDDADKAPWAPDGSDPGQVGRYLQVILNP